MTIRINGNGDSRSATVESPSANATGGTVCYVSGNGTWLNKTGAEALIIAIIKVAKDKQKDCWVDDQFAAQLLKELYYNA